MLFAQDVSPELPANLLRDLGPWAGATAVVGLSAVAAIWRAVLVPAGQAAAEWFVTVGKRQVLFIDEMSKAIPLIFVMESKVSEMRDDIKSLKAVK